MTTDYKERLRIPLEGNEQVRTVDYADYRVGLIYVDPLDLFVEGEPVITKLDRKRKSDVIDLFKGD